MWDLIVSVPDHCLSFYFVVSSAGNKLSGYLLLTLNKKPLHFCVCKPFKLLS